ncbi:hypothetical protein CANCADRAFT_115707 [Tortispora caseinolytica NRRL Y-17796]|uniref:Uncharacterized protein n=1 Tax=Tortispora caseinolytica NRRL Y-17796 TaxID=767744 RepID=A0A1E4TGX0_9ASCO|nr:hypothetical protein CANCADRAFT_115707 [Tortispora caseinolytica NRRL Y-17796]
MDLLVPDTPKRSINGKDAEGIDIGRIQSIADAVKCSVDYTQFQEKLTQLRIRRTGKSITPKNKRSNSENIENRDSEDLGIAESSGDENEEKEYPAKPSTEKLYDMPIRGKDILQKLRKARRQAIFNKKQQQLPAIAADDFYSIQDNKVDEHTLGVSVLSNTTRVSTARIKKSLEIERRKILRATRRVPRSQWNSEITTLSKNSKRKAHTAVPDSSANPTNSCRMLTRSASMKRDLSINDMHHTSNSITNESTPLSSTPTSSASTPIVLQHTARAPKVPKEEAYKAIMRLTLKHCSTSNPSNLSSVAEAFADTIIGITYDGMTQKRKSDSSRLINSLTFSLAGLTILIDRLRYLEAPDIIIQLLKCARTVPYSPESRSTEETEPIDAEAVNHTPLVQYIFDQSEDYSSLNSLNMKSISMLYAENMDFTRLIQQLAEKSS